MRYVRYAEMRYHRQEYTIKVKLPDTCGSVNAMRQAFEEAYRRRYGHVSQNMAIEMLMLRVVVEGRTARPAAAGLPDDAADAPFATRRPIWFEDEGVIDCEAGSAKPCRAAIASPAPR